MGVAVLCAPLIFPPALRAHASAQSAPAHRRARQRAQVLLSLHAHAHVLLLHVPPDLPLQRHRVYRPPRSKRRRAVRLRVRRRSSGLLPRVLRLYSVHACARLAVRVYNVHARTASIRSLERVKIRLRARQYSQYSQPHSKCTKTHQTALKSTSTALQYPRRSSHALARSPHSQGILIVSSHTLRSQHHSFLQQPTSPPSTASTLHTRSTTSASYLPAHCLLSHPHLRSCYGPRVLRRHRSAAPHEPCVCMRVWRLWPARVSTGDM